MRSIVILLSGLLMVSADLGTIQSIAVKGKLTCDNKPAHAVKVKVGKIKNSLLLIF
jgi:hypothetical protein